MTSLRMYYTLNDAAEETGAKPDDLLHLAVRGDIKMLVALPKDIHAQLAYYYRGKDLIGDGPVRMDFFEVSPDDCKEIEIHSSVSQTCFLTAYAKSNSRSWNHLPGPSHAKSYNGALNRLPSMPSDRNQGIVWVAVSNQTPLSLDPERVTVEINRQNLYLLGEDVERICNALAEITEEQKAIYKTSEEASQETSQEALQTPSQEASGDGSGAVTRHVAGKAQTGTDAKMLSALNELGYKQNKRPDDLDALIEEAICEALTPNVTAVYAVLHEYAMKERPPFTGGEDSAGLHFKSGNEHRVKKLSPKNLRDRLRRKKR